MEYIVYKITNTVNNKLYFGITQQSLIKRWQQHKCNSNKKNYHLYNAIKKYGFDKFKIEIVYKAEDKKDMFSKEKELISMYKTNLREYGYNNSLGGELSRFGCKMSNEQKQKISEYQKNRIRKPMSEETKKKISNKAKGRDMSKAILASAEKRRGKPANNCVKVILNNSTIFNSITIASKCTGVSVSSIHNNIKGLSKKTKIGKWEYYIQN